MENLAKTDFKKELEQLKKSLGKKGTIPRLPSFKTKGEILGWAGTEHKVTGNEMNQFVVILDETFTKKKVWETKVYKEFQSIYDTLNALDKEYIDGFMGTFNAVKKASEDSTCAITTLRDRISTQQKEISDLVTIRSNAQKGATALQPTDIANWAKAKEKPSYTAEEVGALPKSIKISDLQGYAEEHNLFDGKQDKIGDLESIRSNAQKGATALQPTDIANWAKAKEKPSYTAEEVGALPKSAVIPSKMSDLENDKGFLTEQDISGKADKSYIDAQVKVLSEKIEDLKQSLENAQSNFEKERQGHIKLKRALVATSIGIGTISVGALIALLILIL